MKPHYPDFALPPLLIVDDCDDDIFLLRHRLREGGITNPLVTFHSAKDAMVYLNSVDARAHKPALFFTDIKMPVDDGFEMIARLRGDSHWDDLRVVVVTSSNHPDDLARALQLRVDGYLIKFPPSDLLAEFVHSGPWFAVPRRAPVLLDALSA